MTTPKTLGALVVDARGMRCPWPALRLARAMRDASDVLLIADDPQAGREVAALAGEHGWSVETDASADEGRWRVRR
ncbi:MULTISPECIES: sulfurtransferase TusA family protein [unclassified Sphingopyxis]|uniref:sulfurtransferase TusA family protein n=1 Tax=unclassified Sphingopyxis TaxID=2614943 RepID=UPI00285F2A11|nr:MULTISPECIES: sulfurtransferase TusA family protein [unclassified Sphingopyxis]MDR7058707.1 tRNA 2-thiouridine synthesizing protein A [Sphingopyxis sp. BE235]MDR7179107.1 tRNA 2-thiouridine synthesizing protein A [Sphingopyxis sp. BE249]